MTPPTKRSQRIEGNSNKRTASTLTVEEGSGSGATGTTSSKRKGREGDHLSRERQNVKKAKRDHQALIAQKLNEIKRIINEIETTEELGKAHLQLLDIRKHVQKKLVQKRANLEKVRAREASRRSLEIGNIKPLHPLLNKVIMSRLVKFITNADLPACRLVCREWNQIVSSHLKNFWTDLTIDTTISDSQDMPLKKFISDIRPGSTLFPLTKFKILLYKIPPPITKFFDMYSKHITHLELLYAPPSDDVASQWLYRKSIVKFLLPAIPNCVLLYLRNFSCQVFTNTSSKLPKRMNLKCLEIQMSCKCSNNNNHRLGSSTFLKKLIIANQFLDTFNFIIDFKQFSDVIIQRLITMLLSFSNVVNLKHIALKSEEDLVRIDWADAQPANFRLKSLEIRNIAIVPLRTFLQHHADSLEKLSIDIESSQWDDLRPDFVGELLTTPKLKQLKSFSVMCLEDQEESLCGLLTGDLFPKLEELELFDMNENFVHAHSLKINNNNAGNNNNSDSEDDEPPEEEIVYSENHIQVKVLKLLIDDSNSPSDYHFLRHSFYGIQHLTLITTQSVFLRPLWTCGFPLKSLDLRVSYDDPDGNEEDEFYIQHLDTIVTGFSLNDCERIYRHVMYLYHSTGFRLDTFNVDWIETICKDKEYPSIRNLNCLQKLSITCSRNSSRLTEVTLATLLLCMKSLTAIEISNCLISQKFISSIRQQLAPGFFMEIDGLA